MPSLRCLVISMCLLIALASPLDDAVIGGRVFNVKEFGADGCDDQDDTAAFRAAIDAASCYKRSTLLFPPGMYRVGAITR
jgi:polygalacturonase